MGIIPFKFAQKITENHQIKHFADLMKLDIILNENLRLFYMGYQRKLRKKCAKIYKTMFQKVENR